MNNRQAEKKLEKGEIIKEILSNNEIKYYLKLTKDKNCFYHKGDIVEIEKFGRYWGYSTFLYSDLNETSEFEIADENEFGGEDNVYHHSDARDLQVEDEIKEGKLKLVEKLNFEKYGFSNKKVIRPQKDNKHTGEMTFNFNGISVKCEYCQDNAEFVMKPKLTKYSVAGEFFPNLKKIHDKIKKIINELGEWKRVQDKELKIYSKKLNELSELKEKGDKYLKLLEDGGEVKIYRFGNKYFADTFVKGSDTYNSQAMNYMEIKLNDPRILKLRKHTDIDIKIYDLAPVGEGEDYYSDI